MIEITRDTKGNTRESDAEYGVIKFGGYQLYSMERPWIPGPEFPSGKPSESCVPVGEYDLVKALSPKYGTDMYYLVNEENGVFLRKEDRTEDWQRWGCMFHPANWVHQINGCVAAGERIGMIGSKFGIGASRSAIRQLTSHMDKSDRPKLKISWD